MPLKEASQRLRRERIGKRVYKDLPAIGYEFTIQETPIGTVMAMQTVITRRRITDHLRELEEDLLAAEGRLAAFGPPPAFAEAEQLQILQQRLNEIHEILNRPEEKPPAPEVAEAPQEHGPEVPVYATQTIAA